MRRGGGGGGGHEIRRHKAVVHPTAGAQERPKETNTEVGIVGIAGRSVAAALHYMPSLQGRKGAGRMCACSKAKKSREREGTPPRGSARINVVAFRGRSRACTLTQTCKHPCRDIMFSGKKNTLVRKQPKAEYVYYCSHLVRYPLMYPSCHPNETRGMRFATCTFFVQAVMPNA